MFPDPYADGSIVFVFSDDLLRGGVYLHAIHTADGTSAWRDIIDSESCLRDKLGESSPTLNADSYADSYAVFVRAGSYLYAIRIAPRHPHEDNDKPEELLGDLCASASDPATVIIYTMAGGSAHWWNYAADGEQKEVYINNIGGCHFQRGMMLFYYEDLPDQLRLEDRDFEADKWSPLVYYA